MILEKLYVADIQKVSGSIERKICAVGIVKLLTQTPTMLTKYSHLWLVAFLSICTECIHRTFHFIVFVFMLI